MSIRCETIHGTKPVLGLNHGHSSLNLELAIFMTALGVSDKLRMFPNLGNIFIHRSS